jgi:hypothetical protein
MDALISSSSSITGDFEITSIYENLPYEPSIQDFCWHFRVSSEQACYAELFVAYGPAHCQLGVGWARLVVLA